MLAVWIDALPGQVWKERPFDVVVVVVPDVVVVVDPASRVLVPGEPTSVPSFAATNAPLTPAALNVEIAPLTPAALSNEWNGALESDTPNVTPVTTVPVESKMFTASPPVLRPTPDPV